MLPPHQRTLIRRVAWRTAVCILLIYLGSLFAGIAVAAFPAHAKLLNMVFTVVLAVVVSLVFTSAFRKASPASKAGEKSDAY